MSAELLQCTGFSHAAFCPATLVILLSGPVAQALTLRVALGCRAHHHEGSFIHNFSLGTDMEQTCDSPTWNPFSVSVKVQTCGSPASFLAVQEQCALFPDAQGLEHHCVIYVALPLFRPENKSFLLMENVNFS